MALPVHRKAVNFQTPGWKHNQLHYSWFFTGNNSKSQNARLAQTSRGKFKAPNNSTDLASPMELFHDTEQYYQYQQALHIAERGLVRKTTPDDPYAHLTAAQAPGQILALTKIDDFKKVTHGFVFSQEDLAAWRARQKLALYVGNYYKFTDLRHPEAWWTLNQTGDRYIVKACGEKSGGCECACGTGLTIQEALHPENRADWRENLLGKALMLVRSHLRKSNRPVDPTQEELTEAMRMEEIDDGRDCLCHDCERYMEIELE